MNTLLFLIQSALMCLGLGVVVLLNILVWGGIWGGIIAIFKRGKKNGRNKDIH